MRAIKFFLYLVASAALFYLLEYGAGPLPPPGKFLSPYDGFWKNAEEANPEIASLVKLTGLKGEVDVKYDDRMVPHIFATNNYDLYYAQGYVTASLRLWQMEFQTHAAAGRISEIVGNKALELDRAQRRKGLVSGAEQALKSFESDPMANEILQAYTDGVNAYIKQLRYADLPLEYKLLKYRPEAWTKMKCALLLKYMADMLTGTTYDLEYTKALSLLGTENFNLVFPDYPDTLLDPVIPSGTAYLPNHFSLDSGNVFPKQISDTSLSVPKEEKPEGLGSNNWAVSGAKTQSGSPILCNDPHLGLNLPSLWFEIQLHAPGMNVYGVSLPGAPCVIIGFNDSIAWGVTNGTEDVKDFYRVKFTDNTHKSYMFDGETQTIQYRLEEIKIRGAASFFDTIPFTHYGPMPFAGFTEDTMKSALAIKWTGAEASNELMTFYHLNRAKNYAEYTEALKYFQCPAQNFVFASASGDIALWHRGNFPLRWPGQGKFIMDGSSSKYQWQGYIPFEEVPHILNPSRNFVSSANQHPTDRSYPYYYSGRFEFYRNRRINERLNLMQNITAEDMMKLQCDNYNLFASEMLPLMISKLDETNITGTQRTWLEELKKWNYFNDPELKAPAAFQEWFDMLEAETWDELRTSIVPQDVYLYFLAKNFPTHSLFDIQGTPQEESFREITILSFGKACKRLDSLNLKDWASYKNTSLMHLARVIAPFNLPGINIGGNYGIINACTAKSGPSWRMVVSMEKGNIKAYGNYPGGQSGNPGSHFYVNQVEKWAKGEYYALIFLASPSGLPGGNWIEQRLTPGS